MNNRWLLLVETVHRLKDIEQVFGCVLWLEPSDFFQPRVEVAFLCQFHDEVDIFLILEVGQQLDDIWVIKRGHDLHFVSQLADHPELLYHFFGDHFEGIFLFGLFAEHANYLAVRTLAESLVYLEVSQTQLPIGDVFKRHSRFKPKLSLQKLFFVCRGFFL